MPLYKETKPNKSEKLPSHKKFVISYEIVNFNNFLVTFLYHFLKEIKKFTNLLMTFLDGVFFNALGYYQIVKKNEQF